MDIARTVSPFIKGKSNLSCQPHFLHFFRENFLAASPWKIFTKKNAAAIQIRFEKRLQGQTATDVTHG
ncbi:hypothetical protein DW946_17320 [Bacteroides caccae]|nr:hypothetical protein DW946_17320 [Bacteroides caccae]